MRKKPDNNTRKGRCFLGVEHQLSPRLQRQQNNHLSEFLEIGCSKFIFCNHIYLQHCDVLKAKKKEGKRKRKIATNFSESLLLFRFVSFGSSFVVFFSPSDSRLRFNNISSSHSFESSRRNHFLMYDDVYGNARNPR